ncbi:MAG: SPFH domain-containing protein [Sphingomonadaceae bacterium]
MIVRLHAYRLVLFVLALLGLGALSSVIVVDEGHQAVIERFGEPLRVVNRFRPDGPQGAGLVFKLPFAERAVLFERGLQGYTLAGQRVHTADEQVVLVDVDVTYRIIDPVRLLGIAGEGDKVANQLRAILPSLVEEQLPQRPLETIATPGAGGAGKAILAALDARSRAFGVQVVDVRIGRVALPEAGLALAYQRMEERHDRERQDIEEQSGREAGEIVAGAQAEAAAIMQASAGQDPEFYGFFKALRNYEQLYGDPERKNAATIVIPPGSAYLKHFNGL